MKIPKKIKIGQIKYKIKFEEIDTGSIGYHETSIYDRNIVIDSRLKKDLSINTFYHEIIHAILYEMGSKKTNDEVFVQSFANILQQVNNQLYGK